MQDSVNEEIQFGDAQVHPGDLVIADGSGVVVIPSARAAEAVAEAEKIAAHEAKMAEGIRNGRSVVEVMESLGYEAMLRKDK
jgi:4-hydroxy-4-methyl-2-oxoglutarate aldolase